MQEKDDERIAALEAALARLVKAAGRAINTAMEDVFTWRTGGPPFAVALSDLRVACNEAREAMDGKHKD
jgi:hypothetical protein